MEDNKKKSSGSKAFLALIIAILLIVGIAIGVAYVGRDAREAEAARTTTTKDTRNSINIGLPILECPDASAGIDDGDEVTVDYDTGIITNVTKGQTYQAEPFPAFIKDMIQKGGLMASLKGTEE